MSNSDICTV